MQMYQAGVRNLDLTFITKEVAWPVILVLSLCITIPYITFMGLFPLLGTAVYTDSNYSDKKNMFWAAQILCN